MSRVLRHTLTGDSPKELRLAFHTDEEARAALEEEIFGSLAGIEEILLLYQGERGRPRARRMLTEMDATQRRLYDLFGLDACASKRLGGAPS